MGEVAAVAPAVHPNVTALLNNFTRMFNRRQRLNGDLRGGAHERLLDILHGVKRALDTVVQKRNIQIDAKRLNSVCMHVFVRVVVRDTLAHQRAAATFTDDDLNTLCDVLHTPEARELWSRP